MKKKTSTSKKAFNKKIAGGLLGGATTYPSEECNKGAHCGGNTGVYPDR